MKPTGRVTSPGCAFPAARRTSAARLHSNRVWSDRRGTARFRAPSASPFHTASRPPSPSLRIYETARTRLLHSSGAAA